MSYSERVAIAAHLHVLLRRKTGRVTDVEWMADHPDYGMAMVAFAREQAARLPAPELAEWADKFARLMDADLARPEKPGLLGAARKGAEHPPGRNPLDRYIGGLR